MECRGERRQEDFARKNSVAKNTRFFKMPSIRKKLKNATWKRHYLLSSRKSRGRSSSRSREKKET